MATDPGDLVLDPTCGSGTTAYVAEQWGRRWITIDTSRVALTLARTRLMAARYPYYHLADTPEGRAQEAKASGLPAGDGPTSGDIRQGFVYKRAPHIQLRDIANNEEIDAIWERFQERLEPLRAALNAALGEAWQEWEIPREAGADWPAPAVAAHGQWWTQRLARQREIDESIGRNSESEILYDQPYEDAKRVRVAGSFTVESLSPHRMIAADEDAPASVREAAADPVRPDFAATIIENLGKAGVQNTKRTERLEFARLDPRTGDPWIHAEGEYRERDGRKCRVAVSIGPEHGTVGAEQVERAARAAIRGIGYDLLVVCGFAFDAHAGEKTLEFAPASSDGNDRGGGFAVAESERQYGKLPVMLARMNPDLAMGDELLKKTGAGNLFTVFGEPDIKIEATPDGEIVVEIRGVDVYDPTSGEVRSASTDEIACWFIDSAYDEQSFFVRHAYFTGADKPYDRLQRALRAEIDEDAWASLYVTRSRPFPVPPSGKIAVKVINHYGDEVLKVYDVQARRARRDGPRLTYRPSPTDGPLQDLAEEQLRAVLARVLEEVLRGALLDQGAFVEEEQPVRHLPREAHLVGDDEHRHARLGQLAHHVEHFLDHLRVERRRGLVEQHDLRLHRQRPRDGDALLLPARQLRGELVGLLGDAHPVEQLHRQLVRLVLGHVPHLLRAERDVAHHRQVREEVELLEDHPHFRADGLHDADVLVELGPVDHDAPGIVLLQPVEAADERRFARAGRPQDDDDLVLLDGQRDLVERLEVAEPLRDALGDDDVRRAHQPAGAAVLVAGHGRVRGRSACGGFSGRFCRHAAPPQCDRTQCDPIVRPRPGRAPPAARCATS